MVGTFSTFFFYIYVTLNGGMSHSKYYAGSTGQRPVGIPEENGSNQIVAFFVRVSLQHFD